MKNRSMIALETLESRTLYSGTPSPTITADLEAIQVAEAQRFNDKSEATQTLLTDRLQLQEDRSTRIGQVGPLELQLQSDLTAEGTAVQTDQRNALATRIADRTKITNDFTVILSDLGNTTAEAADRNQLAIDRATLKTDNAAAAITLQNTRSSFRTTILSDRLAITQARIADDPTIDSDEAKILTDKQNETNTLLADSEAITSAKLKLAQDEAAGA
jgi:hypothetical protein